MIVAALIKRTDHSLAALCFARRLGRCIGRQVGEANCELRIELVRNTEYFRFPFRFDPL